MQDEAEDEAELEVVLESALEPVLVLVVSEEVSREVPELALNSNPLVGQLAYQESEDHVSEGEEHVYVSKELAPSIEQVGLERPLRLASSSRRGVDRMELRGVERSEKWTGKWVARELPVSLRSAEIAPRVLSGGEEKLVNCICTDCVSCRLLTL